MKNKVLKRMLPASLAAVMIMSLGACGQKKQVEKQEMDVTIDQITLGQDRHVAIVQVGGKYLLIGVTSGQVNVLSELRDEELFPLEPDTEEGSTKIPDFKSMMEKLGDIGKRGGKK